MKVQTQDAGGDLAGGIAAILSSNIRQLLVVLNGISEVNYGDAVLLRSAVDSHNTEAVRILLEHGAKPTESILAAAVKAEHPEIIRLIADADRKLLAAIEYRVLQMMFSKLIQDWDNPLLKEDFGHLYGLLKSDWSQANEAMVLVDNVKTAMWIYDLLSEKVQRYASGGRPTQS